MNCVWVRGGKPSLKVASTLIQRMDTYDIVKKRTGLNLMYSLAVCIVVYR